MNPSNAAQLLCPCCGTGAANTQLLLGLYQIQEIIGRPLSINSGYRCPTHNAQVHGAPHSQHLTGRAADISSPGVSPLELYLASEQVPAFAHGAIGLYPQDYIHVDTRGTRTRYFRSQGIDYPIGKFLQRHADMP
jgi:uncharacterized protein YcbK (DUF882 family)